MTGAVVDHLWQSTCIALAIWLWLRAWRGGFASVRHGLLLFAALKFLLPLAVLYALGAQLGYPARYPDELPRASIVAAVQVAQPALWPATYLPDAGRAGAAAPALAALWATGALFCGARWWSSWRAERLAVRSAAALPCGQSSGSTLEVRVSPAVAAPCVVGALRPVLLLPAGAEWRLDAPQLAASFAFAHEQARGRFYAKLQLQRLVQMLFWFHPLIWWIGRALPGEAARACDQRVVAGGHDAAAYANGILAAAGLRRHPDLDSVLRASELPASTPPRPLGFLRGATLAACGYVVLVQAVVAGAVHDHLHRREILLADVEALRHAPFEMTLAAPGMGQRMQVTPSSDGVFIRNASLRELLAVSFGVTRFDIVSNQRKYERLEGETGRIGDDDWLYVPRWDVRVHAPLTEPDHFHGYALHERVTSMLVERFGFEINVNGECQKPCGKFTAVPPDAPGLRSAE